MLTNPVYIIHETKEYDKFQRDETNRPIDYAHLQRMKKSIKRKNFLPEHPITVDADMNLLDGQHRLQAAKELGLPIYYIISATMTKEDVPILADARKQWRLQDRLHTYMARGNADYFALSNFVNAFPEISLNEAMYLCHYSNGDKQSVRDLFVEGDYTCNNLSLAQEAAHAVRDFAPYLPEYYKRWAFIRAIANLVADPRYDHARMMRKVRYQSAKLRPCVRSADYYPILNEIYNYRVPDEERVEFSFRETRRYKKVA